MDAPRLRAALGSLLFLVVAPGVMAGLVPWLITGWRRDGDMPAVLVATGVVLVVAGTGVLLSAFARFVVEGVGTPAPVAPTEELVVGGLYRWVRNPMYLAVAAVIAGQALILGSVALVAWLALFVAAVVTFVLAYEEPTLTDRYGAAYDEYRRSVPGWLPRRPR